MANDSYTLHPKKSGGIALAVLLAAAIFAIWLTRTTQERTREAFAVWWAADLVIDHLKANENRWPGSWEDLRPHFESRGRKEKLPWSFEALQSRVEIDFTMTAERFLKERPRAVRLSSGRTTHWDGREPNELIGEYLRERHEGTEARMHEGGASRRQAGEAGRGEGR